MQNAVFGVWGGFGREKRSFKAISEPVLAQIPLFLTLLNCKLSVSKKHSAKIRGAKAEKQLAGQRARCGRAEVRRGGRANASPLVLSRKIHTEPVDFCLLLHYTDNIIHLPFLMMRWKRQPHYLMSEGRENV